MAFEIGQKDVCDRFIIPDKLYGREIKENPNQITIQTSLKDNQVQITIADNANGMNEEVKQKIFDHLFTTKAVGKGTGLGLAIARQIVIDKHRGSIQVNSLLGEGTEFVILLPIKADCFNNSEFGIRNSELLLSNR